MIHSRSLEGKGKRSEKEVARNAKGVKGRGVILGSKRQGCVYRVIGRISGGGGDEGWSGVHVWSWRNAWEEERGGERVWNGAHQSHVSNPPLLLKLKSSTLHSSPGSLCWPSDAQPCGVGLLGQRPGEAD